MSASTKPTYRIRHCDGNKAAWLLVRLNPDGTEPDYFGAYTTGISLDSLMKHAGHLTPQAGEIVEFIYD